MNILPIMDFMISICPTWRYGAAPSIKRAAKVGVTTERFG